MQLTGYVLRARIFSFVIVTLLLMGAITALTPAFVNVDLFYPARLDSVSVSEETKRIQKVIDTVVHTGVLFSPSSLDLEYRDFNIQTSDNLVLKGWYIPAKVKTSPTLLIVHDLNESKIKYIGMIKQLHDRDLNVCIVDLRAHGGSEGTDFSPGKRSANDVSVMIDSLFQEKDTRFVFLMGTGIGTFIAVQGAVTENRITGIILQNATSNFSKYLSEYAFRKWGSLKNFFIPPFVEKARLHLGIDPADLDLTELMAHIRIPVLYVAGSNEYFAAASESALLKNASASEEKELFLVRNSSGIDVSDAGEQYYNNIAEFINKNVPKKQKKSRYKKLASN